MTAAEVKVEEKQVETEVKTVVEETIEKDESKPVVVEKIVSFKEESNFFSDLKETEKKALSDLKLKLEEAIVGNTLFKTKKEEEKKDEVIVTEEKEKEKIEVVPEEKKVLSNLRSRLEESIAGNTLFKKKKKEKKEEETKTEEKTKTEEIQVEDKKTEEIQVEDKKTEEAKPEETRAGEKKTEETKAEEKTKAVPEERKVLSNLRSRLEEAIAGNTLFKKKKKEKKEEETKTEEKTTEETKTEATQAEETKTEETKAEEKKEEEKVEETKESEVKITEEETKTDEIPKEEVKAENEEEKKAKEEEHKVEEEEVVDNEIALWGVPLLPSKGSEATDVILLKFLRARDFKVDESFEMLKKTLLWRKQHNIDSILNEDFGETLASAAYINGIDRESHPVCYNLHNIFENEELYQNRENFLRWRFQQMEKAIQQLDLKPGGVTSLLQIHDLKNSPGLTKKDVRTAIKQAIEALQDNYPEFVSRNIFINVPFWFYALNALMSPFLTQRTKSKFVVARPVKVTETLLKYIPVEEIPVQYGGFKRENDLEFSGEEITEVFVKPGSSETIEIPLVETGATLVWDFVVLGWEVNYKEEFVPEDEGSYTMIVQKEKKIGSNEGVIRNSFKNSESGKIVITVGNVSSKKKRVLYRYKTKMGSSF